LAADLIDEVDRVEDQRHVIGRRFNVQVVTKSPRRQPAIFAGSGHFLGIDRQASNEQTMNGGDGAQDSLR